MKTSIISVRVLALAFMTFFSLTIVSPAFANGGDTVELRMIGKIKNQPLFQLHFTGAGESEYTVVVKDEYNNILYKETLKGSSPRKFLLNTEEIGDALISFEITGKSLEKPVVFEVNNYSRMVQDVVVNQRR